MKEAGLRGHSSLAASCYLVMMVHLFILLASIVFAPALRASPVETIEHIKPSVVGIGTIQKLRSPPVNFLGTGFVVSDGLHVVTNAHVVPDLLDVANNESYLVITGKAREQDLRIATVVAVDKEHDLILLKITGTPLPAMEFGDASTIREGRNLMFTGFPIGMILGFYPVTHNAMISSMTPIVLPAHNSRQLNGKMINQLQRTSYLVFQLDGTAYPGSSGSPLYDGETGLVYGIVNMVFVKGTKEAAITNPSGISYAIPGQYIRNLLDRK